MSLLLLSSLALAGAPEWNTLLADAGWTALATPQTKATGTIDLRMKEIGGTPCLRGDATVNASRDTLLEVVKDIPAAKSFSSETLLESKFLNVASQKKRHYYQHLDVPNWTMASDRFWILQGYNAHQGDLKAYRWERFDWRTAYPEVAADIDKNHGNAIEPQTNWGAWEFRPGNGGETLVRYYICSDAGGSLPDWVSKAAATKTLPNTMADIVGEAQRRAGS